MTWDIEDTCEGCGEAEGVRRTDDDVWVCDPCWDEPIIINRAELPCQNCAALTTERDAAEESRRFYMAERDRLREALQRMCFAYAGEMAARTAGVDIKGFPLLDAYQHAHFVLYGEDEPSERALAGTGETQ